MAKLPKIKQLIPEDFKDVSWITRLLTPLNSFMRSVTDAFNKGLTVTENMNGAIKTVTVAGSAVSIAWSGQKPTLGIIGNIARTDGTTVVLPAAITLVWRYTQDSKITIDDVIGLDDSPSKQYVLTILFLVD